MKKLKKNKKNDNEIDPQEKQEFIDSLKIPENDKFKLMDTKRMVSNVDIAKALINANGMEAIVANSLGLTVQTVKKRIDSDETLTEIRKHIIASQLDFAEENLLLLIGRGNFPAIKFFLESKGKERGYGKDAVQQQGNKTGVLVINNTYNDQSTNQTLVSNDDWSANVKKHRTEQKKLMDEQLKQLVGDNE